MKITDDMVEAVQRADYACLDDDDKIRARVYCLILAPLILEEAAKIADDEDEFIGDAADQRARKIAKAIRALRDEK